ncbi:MAG: hypothetical protein WC788_07155 [Candidatus Paceibacterota bacterium]|jgi:hypothetical protein
MGFIKYLVQMRISAIVILILFGILTLFSHDAISVYVASRAVLLIAIVIVIISLFSDSKNEPV